MRKCIVQHVMNPDGSQGWKCGRYLMSKGVTFRMVSDHCYHYQCPGRINPLPPCKGADCEQHVPRPGLLYCSHVCEDRSNPSVPKEPTTPIEDASDLECLWETCSNLVLPPQKRFCSSACRSRSSSRTYRKKQRERRCSTQK
jgi:hypothetical protein